jgi:hypothetical protein
VKLQVIHVGVFKLSLVPHQLHGAGTSRELRNFAALKCQTATASPAEPGKLPIELVRHPPGIRSSFQCSQVTYACLPPATI